MKTLKDSNSIINSLSYFRGITKFDKVRPSVYIYGKSAYVIGSELKGRVEFLSRSFENIVSIPFGEGFESSANVKDTIITEEINTLNEQCRVYCDTLFYIDKVDIVKFIDKNYNSQAKVNKVSLEISISESIDLLFKPIKKSVSVFPCEYRVNPAIRICPNFRANHCSIKINALCFKEVLNNDTVQGVIKVEISKKKGFVRLSCISNNVNTKFIIGEIDK